MANAKVIAEFNCTKCGGKETVAGLAVKEQIEKERLPEGTPCLLRREILPIIPPQQAALTVPILIVDWDICAKCGTLYPTRAQTMDAPMTMQQVAPGQGGMQKPPWMA